MTTAHFCLEEETLCECAQVYVNKKVNKQKESLKIEIDSFKQFVLIDISYHFNLV